MQKHCGTIGGSRIRPLPPKPKWPNQPYRTVTSTERVGLGFKRSPRWAWGRGLCFLFLKMWLSVSISASVSPPVDCRRTRAAAVVSDILLLLCKTMGLYRCSECCSQDVCFIPPYERPFFFEGQLLHVSHGICSREAGKTAYT